MMPPVNSDKPESTSSQPLSRNNIQKHAASVMQFLQNLPISGKVCKVLPFVLVSYSLYLGYMLWYNWLLLPVFALVPFATYRYVGGLLFMNVFGYFPSFFITLFTSHNLEEMNVKLWYEMFRDNWKNGDYIGAVRLLIETHNDVLAASFDPIGELHQPQPMKRTEKTP